MYRLQLCHMSLCRVLCGGYVPPHPPGAVAVVVVHQVIHDVAREAQQTTRLVG